jgi:hypothetical protein
MGATLGLTGEDASEHDDPAAASAEDDSGPDTAFLYFWGMRISNDLWDFPLDIDRQGLDEATLDDEDVPHSSTHATRSGTTIVAPIPGLPTGDSSSDNGDAHFPTELDRPHTSSKAPHGPEATAPTTEGEDDDLANPPPVMRGALARVNVPDTIRYSEHKRVVDKGGRPANTTPFRGSGAKKGVKKGGTRR